MLRGTARVGAGTLRGARTVGSKVKVWRVSNDANIETSDLSDGGQQAVGRFVAREGDDGARVLADGGDDALAIITRFDDIDAETVDRLADLHRQGELSKRDLNRLASARASGQIDGSDLRQVSLILSKNQNLIGEKVGTGDIVDVSKIIGI